MAIDDSTVPSGTLDDMKALALGVFDDLTQMGFGDDSTPTSTSDTTLGNEFLRKIFDETPLKSPGAGTYDFSAAVGLTEGNGNTFRETGLFNASSGGDMRFRALLPTQVAKTADKDLSVGIRITVEVENV